MSLDCTQVGPNKSLEIVLDKSSGFLRNCSPPTSVSRYLGG